MLKRGRVASFAAAVAVLVGSLILVPVGTAAAKTVTTCYPNPAGGADICKTTEVVDPGAGDSGQADPGVCETQETTTDAAGNVWQCGIDTKNPDMHWWYVGGGCYSARDTDPWPVSTDPAWNGHKLADNGIIVHRSCSATPSVANSTLMWERCAGNCVNFGPQMIVSELNMQAPNIVMSPPNGGTGFANENIWFWTDSDMSDKSATVNSGANSITGKRKLQSVTVKYGDGTVENLTSWPNCRAHTDADGNNPAPANCGHAYAKASSAQTGGKYAISITVQWTYTYSINNGPVRTPPQQPAPATSQGTITITEGQSTNG